jgi:ElaB/YqjD/DUF883 family membrane-anchored ribosome-binding protein
MPAELLEKPAEGEAPALDVARLKTIIVDAVEDGVHAATQAMKRGRHAAEDLVEDAKHTVKQKPFQTVGIAFAAGILTGGLLGWLVLRRRH